MPMHDSTVVALQARLEGLEAQVTELRRSRRSAARRWLAVGLVTATAASAQLVTFVADQPAQAAQVNQNFTFLQQTIATLRSQVEAKIGSVGSTSVTASAVSATSLTMNNQRITNVLGPAAGAAGDTDVVTKAHLKTVLANQVIFVVGPNCPAGFVAYAAAEDRVPRGKSNGDESLEGVDSVSWSRGLGNIAAVNGGSGGPFLDSLTIASDSNGGSFNVRPRAVRLKPCRFDPTY